VECSSLNRQGSKFLLGNWPRERLWRLTSKKESYDPLTKHREEKADELSDIPNILATLSQPSTRPPLCPPRYPGVPPFLWVQRLECQAKLEILQLLGTFGPLAVSVYGLELGTDDATGQVRVEEADASWNIVCCRIDEPEVRLLLSYGRFEVGLGHVENSACDDGDFHITAEGISFGLGHFGEQNGGTSLVSGYEMVLQERGVAIRT